MKLIYGIIPALVILSVIIINNPIESEAQALESRYAFNIYLIFDAVDIDDGIAIKQAFKNKSETYPLRDHFQSWYHDIENHNGRDLIQINASFTFDEKDDCIAFYNWILDNMPQDIKDNIIYGEILVTDNNHHFPDHLITDDVIVFENTIGNIDDANLQN